MTENKSNQVAEGNYIAQADRGGVASVNIVQRVARLSPSERRNRSLMLKKVRDFWVESVLHNSLYQAVLIDLGMEYKPYAVTYPWRLFFQETKVELKTEIPSGTNIENIFDEQNGELLILGVPGSGKTTMLLHLTEILLNRAVEDETLPIPVVFNLSSWSEQKNGFDKWIIEELNIRYGVPNKIAENWVKKDSILLLLDGLDEVDLFQREKCVESINEYRNGHGFTNIVVCSRIVDYDILETKLKLQAAILIQPLTQEQIDVYLENLGESLCLLRQVIQEDTELQDLAQCPLLLNVMIMVYAGEENLLTTELKTPNRQSELFAAYLAKMFARRSEQTKYPSKDTVRWLAWLAQQMQLQGQTTFFLENLQPAWLETNWQKKSYSILFNIVIKTTMALMWGLYVGLPFGIIAGSIAAVSAALLFAFKKDSTIRTVDTLKWSWTAAKDGIKPSLKSGLKSTWVIFLISLTTGFLLSRLGGITLLALYCANCLFDILTRGLVGNEVESRNRPNQGIIRSLSNAFIGALLYAFFGSIASIILFPVVRRPDITLIASAFMGFVTGWQDYGGLTYLRHYALRFLLWANRNTPLHYVDFLNYAVDRIFLRRVGGGYIFIHRLPMEYFASLGKKPVAQVKRKPPEKVISWGASILIVAGIMILIGTILFSILNTW